MPNLPKGLQHSLIDQIPWEPHVMGDSLRKVLDLNKSEGTYVHYRYTPPGGAEEVRRLHLSINETFFFISGDMPFWEYSRPEDTEGHQVTFRSGTFMDRKPFSIHGRKPYPESETGCTLLIWNSGGGEFEADTSESIKIPFIGNMPKFDMPFTQPTIIDSNKLLWVNHPNRSGWKLRGLSHEANRIDLTPRPVSIVYIPPDWKDNKMHPLISSQRHAWIFVLSGALMAEAAGQKVALREGAYLRWDSNMQLILPTSTSPVGCTLLCVGHNLTSE